MSYNRLGTPNTKDYVLGRGIVYISPLDSADLPNPAWSDLGNAPNFTVTMATESLKHQSSRTGFKTTDVDIIISREISAVAFDLEEQNDQNVALWLLGTANQAQTNAAVAGFAEYQMVLAVILGRWYDIQSSTGVRAFKVLTANVLLEKDDVVDVALVEGTDYVLDLEMGRFFLLTTATNIANGDPLNCTLTADGTAPTVDKVFGLIAPSTFYAVKFVEENPIDNSAKREWQFHRVQPGPSGDLAKIGDTIGAMKFSGAASKNNNARYSASPYCTVSDPTHS